MTTRSHAAGLIARTAALMLCLAGVAVSGSAVALAPGDGMAPGDGLAQDDSTDAADMSDESKDAGGLTEAERRDYERELLTIEEQVNSNKEKVLQAKATLQLLKEIVVQGSSSGSRVAVFHINELGKGFTLESIAYYLDGQGKYSKIDPSGALDERTEFKVFEGAVPPGNHNLTINMKLRGNGFGIFTYAQDYNFDVQSTTAFVAEEGKSCTVRVIATERKGVARSFTERPNVEFETMCVELVGEVSGAEE